MSALVNTRDAQTQLATHLEKARSRLASVLPHGWSPDRVISMVMSAFARDPNLAQVNTPAGLVSIVQATMRAAELGLELNTPLGEGYLVPFWDGKQGCKLVQFMPGYRGYVKLAYQSDRVLLIDSAAVHERDVFSYQRGTHPSVDHKPVISDPGPCIAVYATMRMAPADQDVWKIEVMTMPDVMRIRDRSQGYQAFRNGRIKSTPWDSDEEAMARKTVVARMLKLAPLSEGVRKCIAFDPDMHDERIEVVEAKVSRTDALKDKLGVKPGGEE